MKAVTQRTRHVCPKKGHTCKRLCYSALSDRNLSVATWFAQVSRLFRSYQSMRRRRALDADLYMREERPLIAQSEQTQTVPMRPMPIFDARRWGSAARTVIREGVPAALTAASSLWGFRIGRGEHRCLNSGRRVDMNRRTG